MQILIADFTQHLRHIHVRRASEEARRQTIADVIAEQQFQSRAAEVVYLGGFALDLHALRGRHSAGRHIAAAIYLFDHADLTRRRGAISLQVAQRGDIDPQFASRIQNGRTPGDFDFQTVY
jgi:hypothetical protein